MPSDIYSPGRAHSPVHRLHSRPPTSYRRYLLSSRSRLHPVFLIPVFLLGTLLAPWFNPRALSGGATEREPVYRREDYEWKAEEVFLEPDAPPLVRERVGDEYGTGSGSGKSGQASDRVLARAGHGQGADEWEWWDPSSGTSSSGTAQAVSLFTHDAGLLYFPTSPRLVAPLSPAPEYPVPKPKVPPVAPPPHRDALPKDFVVDSIPVPLPPLDWLNPGDLFKNPAERKSPLSSLHHRGFNPGHPPALHDPIPPKPRGQQQAPGQAAAPARGRGVRNPIGQRVPEAEQAAIRRRVGANAQLAQRAKKDGVPFKPGKPAEVLEKERERERDKERRRKEEEDRRNRQVEWVVVDPRKGKANDETEDRRGAVGLEVDDEDESLDDEAILDAVKDLSEEEKSLLSSDELALIAELEARHRAGVEAKRGAAGQQEWAKVYADDDDDDEEGEDGEEEDGGVGHEVEMPVVAVQAEDKAKPARGIRQNMRERQAQARAQQQAQAQGQGGAGDRPRGAFQPMQGAGQRRRGAGLRKRSFGVDDAPDGSILDGAEVGDHEDESSSSQFVRRGLEEEEADAPSLSSSDRSASTPSSGPMDRLHPIQYLIEKAEEEWDEMLRRQSQTLQQAVEEYERRYKMKPPVGFDSWWRYAMENRVILVDEYDQIYSDLLPYLALSPSDFRRRSRALQTDSSLPWYSNSFGLGVKSGVVKKFSGGGDMGTRGEDLMDILGEFSEMLPEDVEMRFSTGDEAGIVISGEARERFETAAMEGEFLSPIESLEVLEPSGFKPWDSLCAPNSTARRIAQALPVDKPVENPTLRSVVAVDHVKAMDICEHPEIRDLNGVTSWSGPRPYLLYPLFSFSKTSVHADLLVPSISNDFYADVGRDPTWEGKRHNKVLWRGETNGAWFGKGSGWKNSQRARLVALANAQEGETTVHFAARASDDSLRRSTAPTAAVNGFYLDVAFSGRPQQCSIDDKTCSTIQRDPDLRWDLKGEMKKEEENLYKYVLDVDANYQSGRFKRLMSSRSLVMKSTIFPEWWSKRIMPWYHYVPIKSDYSDLVDVSAFFIGAPDGTGSHDHLAKKIAARGQKWSKEHWREVDMAAYMFRLYLEYARLLNRDEKDPHSMDYSP
ncbi:hypothetical protein JCM10212_001994 [Sporobolomyces blumeae]